MLCPRCTGDLAHELLPQNSGRLYCARAYVTPDRRMSDAGAMFEWIPDDTGRPTLTQVSGVFNAIPNNPRPTKVTEPTRSPNMAPAKPRGT